MADGVAVGIPPPPPPGKVPPPPPEFHAGRTVFNGDGSRWEWEHAYFRWRYVPAIKHVKGWKAVLYWGVVLLVLTVSIWGYVQLHAAGVLPPFQSPSEPPPDQPYEPDGDPYYP
jgi:hypothetical protein